MSLTTDTIRQIQDYLASIAMKSGSFDNVRTSEPKKAPSGFDLSVYLQSCRPAASGLISTSVRVEFTIRMYQNMLAEPQDGIDAFIGAAAWNILTLINADVTLGGLVEQVDVLGKDGEAMAAEAGYIEIDNRMHRVMTINVPVKVNDAFDQVRTA